MTPVGLLFFKVAAFHHTDPNYNLNVNSYIANGVMKTEITSHFHSIYSNY